MYTASKKFKAHTDSSIVRRPKSKIIVGGVTYTGETALVSYPKINHSAERMIGVFPAKTCEFELLNRAGDISLNGKEVTVYRGLEIDSEIEWIPMGIFSATDDNITNELTKRTIRFKGTDRSALFDTQFVSDITYPCTVLAFVQHICERHGVALETTAFPFASRTLLSAPNADSSISDREVIARVAELGGCMALISRSGGLRIFKPQSTGKTVRKRYYKTVSQEPQFGAITAITLGHQNYTDDIVYPETAAESAVNWRIEDNPFVDGTIAETDGVTPSTRQTLIADVAANIIGRSLVPFGVTDFVDDFVFDLGDIVSVEKKDGSTFETVILNISTSSRIKSAIGAPTQTQGSTNYALAGSTKQQLKKLALEVDHQNNKITALVQDFSNLENQTESSLSIMSSRIQGVVTDVGSMQSSITQLSNSVDYRFENLATPNSLENAVTSITPEGVKIYNGKIEIYNSANEKIFGTDKNGCLELRGQIRTGESNGLSAELTYGGLLLYNNNVLTDKLAMTSWTDDSGKIEKTAWSTEGDFILANGGLHTNYRNAVDLFAGLTHRRIVGDVYYEHKFGIGKSGQIATGALELRTLSDIAARIDFKESENGGAVDIKANSEIIGSSTGWITLGDGYFCFRSSSTYPAFEFFKNKWGGTNAGITIYLDKDLCWSIFVEEKDLKIMRNLEGSISLS